MIPARQTPGRLAENVMHFARVLRSAGMPVGTDRVSLSLQALQVAGLHSKRELHDVLQSCLLDRVEHRELFDQAFELFGIPGKIQVEAEVELPFPFDGGIVAAAKKVDGGKASGHPRGG